MARLSLASGTTYDWSKKLCEEDMDYGNRATL